MSRLRATPTAGRHRDGVAVAALVALVVLLGACAAPEGIVDGDGSDGAATDVSGDGEQGAANDGDDGRSTAPGDEAAGDDAAVEVEEAPAPFLVPGAEDLTLTTPATAQGQRPLLSWEPVPDAVSYHLSVYDADGVVYWAWSTADAEVVLGGFEAPPSDGARGPRLLEPMTWHVLARDADGRIVAQSGVRPIAP